MNIAVGKDEKDFHCVTENSQIVFVVCFVLFCFVCLGIFLFVLFLRNRHCGCFAL